MMDGLPVILCADQAEYIERAGSWRPGESFPVLDGPSLTRYQKLFDGTEMPTVRQTRRVGRVVSVGGAVSRAAGHLLAAATHRPQRHIPGGELLAEIGRSPDEILAVVGLTDDFADVVDWPGKATARIGLVAARSASALSSLLYRSVTIESAPAEDRFFVAMNALLPGADNGCAVELSELDLVRNNRVRALTIHAPGRECSANLLDTVICGREKPLSIPMYPEPGLRATPCLLGDGCFRADLAESEILQAADLNAAVIYLNTCSAIAIGAHAYPYGLSVALGALEGTAVAVVGVVGTTFLQLAGERNLQCGLSEGLPLGEIVHEMTLRNRPLAGDLSRFGLLGDPGIVMPWNTAETRASTAPRSWAGPWDEEALARLTALNRDVIPRLERLRWLGLSVPDEELLKIRQRIRQLTVGAQDAAPRPAAEAEVEEVEEALVHIQQSMVGAQLQQIFRTGWTFVGPAYRGLTQVSEQAVTCPSCGEPRATRATMQHQVEPELFIQTLQCLRCGIVWWSTEPDERTVAITGPIDVRARLGEVSFFDRQISNHGADVLRGAVGYTFRHHDRGLPAPEWTETCWIAPDRARDFRPVLDLRVAHPLRDAHTTPFIALLNGIYTASAATIQIE
ncbi:hypothetical protein [Nonomuraea sp. NPDC050786]|uniref:hypothetical protein n=1 Tax=Nonomuraea sp. NPDC050786 TaxID=3154840 RepID=UPI0033D0C7E3